VKSEIDSSLPLEDQRHDIVVYLRDIITKVKREYKTTGYFPDGVFNDYIWSDGNYECDCNRSLFLYDHDESKEYPCNIQESQIIIDKIVRVDTGEVVYAEN